jgi:hypothetical protein
MTFTSRDISRRSFLIGGLAAVSVPLLLSGCAPSSAPQGQGALRIAWWGGEARTAKMNEILAMYEAERTSHSARSSPTTSLTGSDSQRRRRPRIFRTSCR